MGGKVEVSGNSRKRQGWGGLLLGNPTGDPQAKGSSQNRACWRGWAGLTEGAALSPALLTSLVFISAVFLGLIQ